MAAVAGLTLGETVGQVLGIEKHEWMLLSEIVDVLYWIRGQSRKNRVGEIQALTKNCSRITQLLSLLHITGQALDRNVQTDISDGYIWILSRLSIQWTKKSSLLS